MTRTLWAIVIVAAIVFAGVKAYSWIERAEAARSEQREQMVRKIAEDRAAEMERVIGTGGAGRTDAITRQVEQAKQGRNLDSLLQR